MLKFEIEQDQATPWLKLASEKLGDMTEPLTSILEDGLQSAQTQVVIGKGAAFGGASWVAMAPATIKTGRNPATLLVKSGELADSLLRGAAGNFFEVTPFEAVGGSSVDHAAYQYNGTSRIPARPFPAWYAERFEKYDRIIGDWVTGEASGNA